MKKLFHRLTNYLGLLRATDTIDKVVFSSPNIELQFNAVCSQPGRRYKLDRSLSYQSTLDVPRMYGNGAPCEGSSLLFVAWFLLICVVFM